MTPGIYNLGTRVITSALTDQVITEGSSTGGVAQAFVDRLDGVNAVSLFAKFDWGSGGTTVSVIVETSLNSGDDWVEVAEFDFGTADAKKTACVVANAAAGVSAVSALGSESVRQGVLGDRLRARVTSVGTYGGGTTISVRAAVR